LLSVIVRVNDVREAALSISVFVCLAFLWKTKQKWAICDQIFLWGHFQRM